ncbi:hypothetical protein HAX54_028276 [Datura stramonium]|uniref:Uncharacterized protein n=1 Tax=Datura stramonium TaxID=4076 RepID=A0ABS8S9G5_DATST|nr:hypothetical protein [Datura stramonium]
MASWNENGFGGYNSYIDDSCPYCGGHHFWKDCEDALGREICASSYSYNGYYYNLCGGQGGYCGDFPNYYVFSPRCSNENASFPFEFDMNNDRVYKRETARFERIQAMLQILLDGNSSMGDINKFISENVIE